MLKTSKFSLSFLNVIFFSNCFTYYLCYLCSFLPIIIHCLQLFQAYYIVIVAVVVVVVQLLFPVKPCHAVVLFNALMLIVCKDPSCFV